MIFKLTNFYKKTQLKKIHVFYFLILNIYLIFIQISSSPGDWYRIKMSTIIKSFKIYDIINRDMNGAYWLWYCGGIFPKLTCESVPNLYLFQLKILNSFEMFKFESDQRRLCVRCKNINAENSTVKSLRTLASVTTRK